MSSTITHASFVALAYSFPQFSFFPLLLGLVIPDIDVMFNYALQFLRGDIDSAVYSKQQGIMHTLLGLIFIALPLCTSLTYLYDPSLPLSTILISSAVGLGVHILLDIPGHSNIGLLWPKVFENPFLFTIPLPWLERFYPLSSKKMLPEYNWFIVSHLFILPMIPLYIS